MATILIVDDAPENLAVLSGLLSPLHTVRAVTSGQRALQAAASQPRPDLILLDVMMPKKSGFEVCQALRTDPVQSAVKIIMLTAKGRETEVTKGLALGADAYVTKPFSTKDLVQRIKSLLA